MERLAAGLLLVQVRPLWTELDHRVKARCEDRVGLDVVQYIAVEHSFRDKHAPIDLIKGENEPLITEEVFEKCQEVQARPRAAMTPMSPATASDGVRLSVKSFRCSVIGGQVSSAVFSSQLDSDPYAGSLIAFLNSDPVVREEFPRQLHSKLVKFAARRLVPGDLAEEAVQQMWVLLLRKDPSSFDPTRVSALRYILLLLRNAARIVRASYTPPGHRTRTHKDSSGLAIQYQPVLSLESAATAPDVGKRSTLRDLIPDPINRFEDFEERLQVQWLLNKAGEETSAPVSQALRHIYYDGANLGTAAHLAGISRFQLRRGIAKFRVQLPQTA